MASVRLGAAAAAAAVSEGAPATSALACVLPAFFQASAAPRGASPRRSMAFVLSTSLLLTYLNYRGLSVVGNTAMSTTLFIAAPFLLLCLLAAPHARPENWFKLDLDAVQWGTYLNIMFWNLVRLAPRGRGRGCHSHNSWP